MYSRPTFGEDFGFGEYGPPWFYGGIGWGGLSPFWIYGAYGPAAGYPPVWVPYPSHSWVFGGWEPYGGLHYSAQEETQFLKDEAKYMRKDLEEIEARIQELEKKKAMQYGDLTTLD